MNPRVKLELAWRRATLSVGQFEILEMKPPRALQEPYNGEEP